jgi:DNA-binding NarL/FixJ family response regulator
MTTLDQPKAVRILPPVGTSTSPAKPTQSEPGTTEHAEQPDSVLTRVVFVDHHQAFSDALGIAFEADGGFASVGSARTPSEARELLRHGADVALVEAELDGHDGIELVRELKTAHPQVRFIVTSGRRDPHLLERALAAGAAGFIPKSTCLKEFISWARQTLQDQAAIPVSLLSEMYRNQERQRKRQTETDALRAHLTVREIEILQLIAAGLTTKTIAGQLVLSVTTIRTHVQHVLTKLNAHSRMEAVNYALTIGLIEPTHRDSTSR